MTVIRPTRKSRVGSSSISTHSRAIAAISAATGLVAWAAVSRADTFGANGSSTVLDVPSAWTEETVGGADSPPPGVNDIGQFDSLAGSTTSFTLGGSMSWLGLSVVNPSGAITIGNDGNTLTLGADGIEMDSATQNLTLSNTLVLGASQSWTNALGTTITVNGSVDLGAANTLTFAGAGNQLISGVLSDSGGITNDSTGTVTLTNANTYTGNTTVNSGTLLLNFAAAGAPASNIISSSSTLVVGGGNLTLSASSGSPSQTFASTTLNPGNTVISIANSGGGTPILNLGTFNIATTSSGGTIEFVGPATIGSGNTSVAATGQIQTSFGVASSQFYSPDANGTSITGVAAGGLATVGLYDWAAKDATNTFIVGGSQVAGFYTAITGASATANGANEDVVGGAVTSTHNTFSENTIRFNDPASLGFNATSTADVGGVLVTPNIGANNVAITTGSGGFFESYRGHSATELVVWQNNTQGFLTLPTLSDSKVAGSVYTQAGPGTVVMTTISNGAVTPSTYTGQNFLNGGVTEIGSDGGLGSISTAAAVNLDGGALVGNAPLVTGTSFALDDAGSDPRPVVVGATGGTLAAVTNTEMTVDGVISGTGPLTIGYGTLPGSGVGTANTTAINGNGTVVLSGANTYSGGTAVNFGTLRIDSTSGSAGTGNVVMNSGTVLSGTGTITNNVIVNSGAHVQPGDTGIGTLNVGGLTLNNGSILDFGFNGLSNDMVDMSDTHGLTINGIAGINVDNTSGGQYTSDGTYDIFQVAGGNTANLSDLQVLNPKAGLNYTFADSGDFVTLTIAGGGVNAFWNVTGGGAWETASNWSPATVPTNPGDTANLDPNPPGITSPSTITFAANHSVGTLNFQNSDSYTIAESAGGNFSLTMDNKGGGAAINDNLGSHFINVPLILSDSSGLTTIDVAQTANSLTINGAVSGNDGVEMTGNGTLVFAANNSYTGATSIDSGTLQVGTGGASGSLGTSAANITLAGTLAYDVSGNVNVTNNFVPSGNSVGNLVQSGTGTLTLSGNNITISGSNTLGFGSVTVNSGTLQLNNASALYGSGDLTMGASAVLDLNGNNATVGGLAGGGTIGDVAGGGTPTLTFGGDSNNNTFSGTIQNGSGTVSIVKSGGGTEILSGTSTYTGTTTMNGGVVKVTNSAALGASAVTINGAGTELELGDGVNVANAISIGVGSNQFIDVPDASASATLSGSVTVIGGTGNQYRLGTTAGGATPSSTLTLTGANDAVGSQIVLTQGNLIFAGNSTLTSTSTSAMLVSRSGPTLSLNLTLQDNASMSNAGGINLGGNTSSSDNLNTSVILNDNSSINGGTGALNLDASEVANNTVTLTLNGNSNLSIGSITTTPNDVGTAASAIMTFNGGGITATASDADFASGTYFLPNLSVINVVNIGPVGVPVNFSVASGGGFINNGGFSITLAQSFSDGGGGGLNFLGAGGTTILANSNTFSGNATLTSGTLVAANGSGSATGSGSLILNGGILASASASQISSLAINLGATAAGNTSGAGFITGTVIAGSGAHTIAPGGIGTIGTLTLGALTTNSNTTLDFDLGSPVSAGSYTGDLIDLTSGPLTVGSGTDIIFGTDPTTSGDYRLFGGSFGSPNLANFVLPSSSGGVNYSLSTSVDSGYLDLVVVAPLALTWDNLGGTGNGTTWDTTQQNWNNGTGPATFSTGNSVTFNDTNNNHYAVTLNGTVSPASVTVNNSAGNYTISGTGGIAGTGSLTKEGSDTLTLSTVNTYSGGTDVTAGKLIINAAGALPASHAVSITGGVLELAANTGGETLSSLSITTGGALDIGNNHIILSDPSGAIDATIRDYLINGYNNGNWNGTSATGGAIITSSATSTKYGIGYADGADGGISGITSGQLEVKYTLYGDANLDGSVNSIDFGDLAANFGKSGKIWDQGDFNYDGTVNSIDFGLLAGNFGKSVGSNADVVTSADWAALDAFAAANGLTAEVPEPATTSLVAVGLIGVLARRRRRVNA